MSLRLVPSNAGVILEVAGEIDAASGPELIEACASLQRDQGQLVVDFGGVTFCDSSGIRALLQLREHAAAGGAAVRVTHASPQLRRILDGLHLADLLLS